MCQTWAVFQIRSIVRESKEISSSLLGRPVNVGPQGIAVHCGVALSALYLNKGDGTFQDASFYSGFALNQDARETASMGIAVGDYANNGNLDLYTTTFSDDYKTLYRNEGEGNFVDITPQMGIAEPTYPILSWGT